MALTLCVLLYGMSMLWYVRLCPTVRYGMDFFSPTVCMVCVSECVVWYMVCTTYEYV